MVALAKQITELLHFVQQNKTRKYIVLKVKKSIIYIYNA